jgi:peptide/nickel transport system substrate-binding protein
MLTRYYRSAVYDILEYSPDLQAYRTDRFTGWLKQPAKTGPVIFSNTSPTYASLKPIKTSKAGIGPEAGGRAVGALMLLVAVGLLIRTRRERPTEVAERARARR